MSVPTQKLKVDWTQSSERRSLITKAHKIIPAALWGGTSDYCIALLYTGNISQYNELIEQMSIALRVIYLNALNIAQHTPTV